MDSSSFDKLHAEKANAILKYRQLRKIANLLRFIEVCAVLVMISRLSIQLPLAVKNSSEYFRDFSVFVVSPRFVFLVGNAIIITLFAQSGQFSAHGSAKKGPEPDLYQQFIQNSTKNQKIHGELTKDPEKHSIGIEDGIESQCQRTDGDQVKYPEKQCTRTVDTMKSRQINGHHIKYSENEGMELVTRTEDRIKDQGIDGGETKRLEKQSLKTGDPNSTLGVKEYRRCQTEIVRCVESEKPRRVLRRCETGNSSSSRSIQIQPERVARSSYPEDGMSNEEFRRTIEAFIARQQRLRREEECCPV